jgi:hypothetical protein
VALTTIERRHILQLPNFFKSEERKTAEESETLRSAMLETEAEWPQIEAEIQKIGNRCIELLPKIEAVQKVETALRMKLPDAKIWTAEYNAEIKRGISLRDVHGKKKSEIINKLAGLNYQIRCNYNDEFRNLANDTAKLKRFHRLGRVPMHRGEFDYFDAKITSNLDALKKRKNLALEAASAILGMQHNSIPEIEAAAEEWVNKIAAVNIAEMLEELVPARVADEAEGKNIPKFEQHEDAQRINTLSDRITKLEKGKK